MSTSTPSPRTQRRVQRLEDPRLDTFRTPRARRRLVGALIALLVVEALCLVGIDHARVAGLMGFAATAAVFVVCLGALKASTRGVEELPAAALDERQRQVRGETYARSYRIGFALLTVELAVAAVWSIAGWPAPGAGVLSAAVLLPFHVGLVLPAMVAASSRTV